MSLIEAFSDSEERDSHGTLFFFLWLLVLHAQLYGNADL